MPEKGPGGVPQPESEELRKITGALQRLHDRGVIDLNAPLRDVAPYIQEKIKSIQTIDEEDRWWLLQGCEGGRCWVIGYLEW
jgi:hypothetical protein